MSRRDPAGQERRLAWALTGSGDCFAACRQFMRRLEHFDPFVSRAAAEVIRMDKAEVKGLPEGTRIVKDTTASAVPVGLFYQGVYHTPVLAPATSNTAAKCVAGICDTLAAKVFAQAGKCRIPSIVFACDTAPGLESMAPAGMVEVFARRIDLENVERLRGFEATQGVVPMAELEASVMRRMPCAATPSS
jgi:dihydromethanopterin reductase (acceptor)